MRKSFENQQQREEWDEWHKAVIEQFESRGLTSLGPETRKLIQEELTSCLGDHQIRSLPSEIINRVVWKIAGINLIETNESEKNKKSFWEKISHKLASY